MVQAHGAFLICSVGMYTGSRDAPDSAMQCVSPGMYSGHSLKITEIDRQTEYPLTNTYVSEWTSLCASKSMYRPPRTYPPAGRARLVYQNSAGDYLVGEILVRIQIGGSAACTFIWTGWEHQLTVFRCNL